jgi:hypothetical protein
MTGDHAGDPELVVRRSFAAACRTGLARPTAAALIAGVARAAGDDLMTAYQAEGGGEAWIVGWLDRLWTAADNMTARYPVP